MRILFFLTLISLLISASLKAENTLKERIQNAKVGDYIASKHGKTIVLVFLKELSKDSVVIEELSLDEEKYNSSFSWQEWLNQRAPGHLSWTLYEIDLNQNKLIECFSIARGHWISVHQTQSFFASFLALPMNRIPKSKCRKIGSPPSGDEIDNRPLWKPALIVNGKKQDGGNFIAYESQWPKDESVLSLSHILLYYSEDSFPFPFWTEVSSGYYTLRISTIDSGRNLISTSPKMPRKMPLSFPNK